MSASKPEWLQSLSFRTCLITPTTFYKLSQLARKVAASFTRPCCYKTQSVNIATEEGTRATVPRVLLYTAVRHIDLGTQSNIGFRVAWIYNGAGSTIYTYIRTLTLNADAVILSPRNTCYGTTSFSTKSSSQTRSLRVSSVCVRSEGTNRKNKAPTRDEKR